MENHPNGMVKQSRAAELINFEYGVGVKPRVFFVYTK